MKTTATTRATNPAQRPKTAFERACEIAFQVKPVRAETAQILAGFDAPGQPTRAVAVRSRHFIEWMRQTYRDRHGEYPRQHTLREARNTFEGRVWLNGPDPQRVARRILAYGRKLGPTIELERFVIDLARPGGQVIEVGRDGWRIAPGAGHCFYTSPQSEPLPLPAAAPDPASTLERFRQLLGVSSYQHWRRLLIWLASAISPAGPYAALVLHGPAGSGKSRAARLIRNLIDPVSTPPVPASFSTRKIEAAAWATQILNIGTVRRLTRRVAWTLERICLDATHELTEPHSGRENVGVEFQRPVILSIERDRPVTLRDPVIRDEDFARQSLTVALDPAPLLSPAATEAEYETLRPRLLSVLCHAASAALASRSSTATYPVPRLLDLALWAAAATPLEFAPEQITEALLPDTESTALAWALQELIPANNSEWTGTLTTLRSKLPHHTDPGSPESLSKALRRRASSLKNLGLTVDIGRSNGIRTVTVGRHSASSGVFTVPFLPNKSQTGTER